MSWRSATYTLVFSIAAAITGLGVFPHTSRKLTQSRPTATDKLLLPPSPHTSTQKLSMFSQTIPILNQSPPTRSVSPLELQDFLSEMSPPVCEQDGPCPMTTPLSSHSGRQPSLRGRTEEFSSPDRSQRTNHRTCGTPTTSIRERKTLLTDSCYRLTRSAQTPVHGGPLFFRRVLRRRLTRGERLLMLRPRWLSIEYSRNVVVSKE